MGLAMRRWLLALGFVVWFLSSSALAADGVVTGVEPASAGQGETVLLTITGTNLPQGTVVIEFFPQQIALLDVLSANATELQALVKVARTAPPGNYNVIVYNQRGEEAFGGNLLSINATIVTPVFKSCDPKTIADATNGFALLLTGEYITDASISHLTVDWEQNGSKVAGLVSSFSMGGNRAVVCAVEGQPPPGVLRGRIFLDDVPIYLVEITVEGGMLQIIGHTPAQLSANLSTLKLKLLGNELTEPAVRGLEVELVSEALTAKAQQVVWLDSASCEVQLSGPLPAGEYSLVVISAGSQVYSSPLTLVNDAPSGSDPTGEGETGLDGTGAEPTQEGVVKNSAPQITDLESGQSNQGPVPPSESNQAVNGDALGLSIKEVTPPNIDPTMKACRFTISTAGVDSGLLREVNPVLTFADETATLLLSGSSGSELTCVFSPPASGWQPGTTGELSLRVNGADAAAAIYPVHVLSAPAPATAEVPTPAAVAGAPPATTGDSWQAATAAVETATSGMKLIVTLIPPGGDADAAGLEGSFTLLPDELGYADLFANITLSGPLAISHATDGSISGEAKGVFVSGSLMVTIRKSGGTPQLSMLHLDCGQPEARVTGPDPNTIRWDPVSGKWVPPALCWTLDTAPFIVADTRFLLVLDATGQPVAAFCNAAENSVQVECATSNLLAGERLEGQFDCSLPLRISGERMLIVERAGSPDTARTSEAISQGHAAEQPQQPVLADAAEASGGAVSYVEPKLHFSAEGFWVVLATPAGVDLAVWRDVKIQTNDLLLQSNLAKFTIEVQVAREGGEPEVSYVRLLLRRDAEQLPDPAYDLLCRQLQDSGTCSLGLTWLARNCSVEANLTVVEAAWSTTLP